MSCAARRGLRALVELGHYEFAVTEGFGAGEAAVASAEHYVDQLITSLVHGHFAAQDSGDVEIDVLAHGACCFWIGGELDYRFDGIADYVALACRKEMNDETRGGLQGYAFRGGGRSVHVIEAGAFRGGFGRF